MLKGVNESRNARFKKEPNGNWKMQYVNWKTSLHVINSKLGTAEETIRTEAKREKR